MSIFKKKNAASAAKKKEMISFDKSRDFEFVQLDKSIHDTKFDTKPTTYFKDALKRFAKSKSAVTAAVILGVLIVTSVIVPMANGNSINGQNTLARNLPPKWFSNANGFMDGTGWVSGTTINPSTGLPVAVGGEENANSYVEVGIMGGKEAIQYSEVITDNIASGLTVQYGWGGSLTAFPTVYDVEEVVLYSPKFTIDLNEENSYSYVLDAERSAAEGDGGNPVFSVYFGQDVTDSETGKTTFTPKYELVAASTDYQSRTIDLSSAILNSAAYEAEGAEAATVLTGSIAFVVKPEGVHKSIFINESDLTLAGVKNDVVSFDEAVRVYQKKDGDTANARTWLVLGQAQARLYGVHSKTGSFRYDYYAAAYADRSGSFSKTDVNEFIARGWMTYEWQNRNVEDASMYFKLTPEGEKYCPIRSVVSEKYSSFGDIKGSTLVCVQSNYRLMYYKGLIGECAPVYFLFGTDGNGNDFFKVVFSGLLTSLCLGFLASIINISIGLLWGSISGYFGGWTDIIMERCTEIMGGMPQIVVMTLVAMLLGSNFGTFLLALCLTGWIGISGTTRSQFYRFKRREYVLASRTLGASDGRLIFRHILPNGIGMIITSGILMIPSVIFAEASISYILPGVISFGSMTSFGVTLSQAQKFINTQPYMIVSASIVMAIIMICFNLFGNGLRDAFNPSMKGNNE